MKKNNNCKDCNKEIYEKSTYCKGCYNKHRKYSFETRINLSNSKLGIKNPNYGKRGKLMGSYKGGYCDRKGYKGILIEGKGKYILEHRKIIVDNGLKIPKGVIVHHIDSNKQNNQLSNLELLSISEHMKLHSKMRIRDKNGRFAPRFKDSICRHFRQFIIELERRKQ